MLNSPGNSFEDLMKLFSQLLIQSDGNIGQALTWLTSLDERYNLFSDKPGQSMSDFIDWLKEQGLLREDPSTGDYSLTSKGNRRIRQDSLDRIFSNVRKAPGGEHSTPDSGIGTDRLPEIRPFRFGDIPANIDFTSSISNAIRRAGSMTSV